MLLLPHKRQVLIPACAQPFIERQAQEDLAVSYATVHSLAWDGCRPNKVRGLPGTPHHHGGVSGS